MLLCVENLSKGKFQQSLSLQQIALYSTAWMMFSRWHAVPFLCSAAYPFHIMQKTREFYRVHIHSYLQLQDKKSIIVGLKYVAFYFALTASLWNAQFTVKHIKGWFPNLSKWCRCLGKYLFNKPRSYELPWAAYLTTIELCLHPLNCCGLLWRKTHTRKKPVYDGESPNHLGPAVCKP